MVGPPGRHLTVDKFFTGSRKCSKAAGTNSTEELVIQGLSKSAAKDEVEQSIDRLVYYAGWADKYQQIFSTVNPVATPHYNFSVAEAPWEL